MTWLGYGTHVAFLSIETLNIKDVEIEPDTSSPFPPPHTPQPLPDPAISSFNRSTVNKVPKPPSVIPHNAPIKHKIAPAAKPAVPTGTKPLENVGATATLTEPFTELALQETISNGVTQDQEQEALARATTKKRRNRRPTKGRQDELQLQSQEPSRKSRIAKRADGWGEPPFLQETPIAKKTHPLDAPIHRAEQRLAQARKGRRQNHLEERNGWATEEATDIQDLGDFDFQGNLSKFDKRGVFDRLRQDDTTADEARLVSFNRLSARPGTNGGRNLHYTENVLDSPKQNGRVSWNDEEESENSEVDRFSSGRNSSRRNLSCASIRKPPSRKNSAMVPHDQTSSSGLPYRYSSQEHHRPNPRIKVKTSTPRYPGSESPRASGPTFQLAASGTACPCVTPLQMLELEQLATSELGLSDDMMAENAACCIAQMACRIVPGGRVIILAGNTKTGARAIAAGRQLRNHGSRVMVFVLGVEKEKDLLEIVRRQLGIYRNSGGQIVSLENLLAMGDKEFALVIDALLGMHLSPEDLRTADRNTYSEICNWLNDSDRQCLAVDVPSGMDFVNGRYWYSSLHRHSS